MPLAPAVARKPTGLLRGQAAKISRIHQVSISYVLQVATSGKGRPALLKTIEQYRARNAAATLTTNGVSQ